MAVKPDFKITAELGQSIDHAIGPARELSLISLRLRADSLRPLVRGKAQQDARLHCTFPTEEYAYLRTNATND
jgi:hypothetical protein